MTFITKAPPTFEGSITITGQGRAQKLDCVFRHMLQDDYGKMFQGLASGSVKPEDAILRVVVSWNADRPLTAEGVREILQDMPAFDWALLTGYGQALTVSREGNS